MAHLYNHSTFPVKEITSQIFIVRFSGISIRISGFIVSISPIYGDILAKLSIDSLYAWFNSVLYSFFSTVHTIECFSHNIGSILLISSSCFEYAAVESIYQSKLTNTITNSLSIFRIPTTSPKSSGKTNSIISWGISIPSDPKKIPKKKLKQPRKKSTRGCSGYRYHFRTWYFSVFILVKIW